ncbi:helix-turn-helix domain-containing protein, partial [Streptomyces sp. Cmuel-A718b]|uniref:helix-turn-helix domain-containing protein n=2 Tax=unclassified Streptomyces TaxID=2593676 RepID=UPI00081F4926
MTRSTTDEAAVPPLPSPKERRRLREAKSLSEDEVAAAVGVTRATVRSWETGRTSPRGRKRALYAKLIAPEPAVKPTAKPTAKPTVVTAKAATAGARPAADRPTAEPAAAPAATDPPEA